MTAFNPPQSCKDILNESKEAREERSAPCCLNQNITNLTSQNHKLIMYFTVKMYSYYVYVH